MRADVALVMVYVTDQERALRFYTERLGCERRFDEAFGEERWIEVAPSGVGVHLVLADARHYPGGRPGSAPVALLRTADVRAAYDELTARGVRFAAPSAVQQWGGTSVGLVDPDGNVYWLARGD